MNSNSAEATHKRAKGLFYCQYFVGVGHLTRSLHICRQLIKHCDIDFLCGGYPVDIGLDSSHFHTIYLPSIELNELEREDKWAARNAMIQNIANHYDFLVVEFFPFSKWILKDEIETLINVVKAINPKCVVVCSLRDSFPNNPVEQEWRIIDFINTHYDKIFVHMDPKIFTLQESFKLAEHLAEKIIYTGFITNPDGKLVKKRKKTIVVTIGAGSFGDALMYAAATTAPFFPDYEYTFIIGPKTPSIVSTTLVEMAHDFHAKNIRIIPFQNNFHELLSESTLLISLGGYTIIDAIYTHTPALVFPWIFPDQYTRTHKFAALGLITPLTREDLNCGRLCQHIKKGIAQTHPAIEIDMSGAQTTCAQLLKLLKNQ